VFVGNGSALPSDFIAALTKISSGGGGNGFFGGFTPDANLARYPGDGFGIFWFLQRLAMATSEMPKSAASFEVGPDQTKSYNSRRVSSDILRIKLVCFGFLTSDFDNPTSSDVSQTAKCFLAG
jgi:hypothetical protein